MINTFCKRPLWECTRRLAAVAQGTVPADTVIKDARLVNVCTHEIQEGVDVAIAEGRVAYVGQADHCVGEGTRVIDAAGCYVAPGFLDGHIHIESSMMTPYEFARTVVPHGTVGVYIDPHEICNVLGLPGVRIMLDDAKRAPLKTMLTVPSCIPSVPGFEDPGSYIGPEEIAETMTWPETVALGEMMDYPGVLAGSAHDHGEIAATLSAGRTVTGHYAQPETDRGLNAYVASGIRCCHESTRAEDAIAKMRLGMYAQFRYGSAGKDLPALARVVAEGKVDTRFACLVTDDAHPHTLAEKGHADRLVRTAVQHGIDPVTAIQMVTINTAQCYQMDHELGSVAPGKCADIVFIDDLEACHVTRVLIDGEVVAEDGRPTFSSPAFEFPELATHSMHVGTQITPETFRIPAPEGCGDRVTVRAVEVRARTLLTQERRVDLPVADGCIESDLWQDALKAFVFERHHATGLVGRGFVTGFGITSGAMASTVAHDAHNLIVVGANDADMALAANELVACGGGMVVVKDGEVLGKLELPIAGLMDTKDAATKGAESTQLQEICRQIGCKVPSPFMIMAFVSLPCIPSMRITDRGIVNCDTFEFEPLVVEEGEKAGE